MKKIYLFLLIACISIMNINAQKSTEIKVGNKTYIKTDYTNRFFILNKSLDDNFQKNHKGKNKTIDPEVISEKTSQVKIKTDNETLYQIFRHKFITPKIDAILRIDKNGKIINITFMVNNNVMGYEPDILTNLSEVEDELIKKMVFNVPDNTLNHYTIMTRITLLSFMPFPENLYMNP